MNELDPMVTAAMPSTNLEGEARRVGEGEIDRRDPHPAFPASEFRSGANWHNVDIYRLSERLCRNVSWLWPGRIALGKLTLVNGDPGAGKSLVMLDVAARVTRGAEMPAARG